MNVFLEFSKNGVVTRTMSLLIPVEGKTMADAATITVKAAPAALANKSRFAFLLTAKDAVLTRSASGWNALGRLANKARLGGAFRWISNIFGWAVSKLSWVRRIGVSGLLGLIGSLITTHTGQAIVKAVVKAVVKPFAWLAGKAYGLLSGAVRMFGKRGQAAANRMDLAVYSRLDRMNQALQPTVEKLRSWTSPDNAPMQVVAGLSKAVAAQAIIAAFVPGGWVYLAYVLAAPLVFPALRPSRIKQAYKNAMAEADTIVAASEIDADSVVIATKKSFTEAVADKAGEAYVRVAADEAEALVQMDEPVLSRNARKAEQRRQADQARKENAAKNAAMAAERRAAVAAAKRDELATA